MIILCSLGARNCSLGSTKKWGGMCAARVFLSGLIVSAVLATGISLPANAVMAVPDTALVSPAAASPEFVKVDEASGSLGG